MILNEYKLMLWYKEFKSWYIKSVISDNKIWDYNIIPTITLIWSHIQQSYYINWIYYIFYVQQY